MVFVPVRGFADDKWPYRRLERAVARSACVGDKIMLLVLKDISCGPTGNISCQQAQAPPGSEKGDVLF
jgi:hypothetical protein